jgi:hypothetical protein
MVSNVELPSVLPPVEVVGSVKVLRRVANREQRVAGLDNRAWVLAVRVGEPAVLDQAHSFERETVVCAPATDRTREIGPDSRPPESGSERSPPLGPESHLGSRRPTLFRRRSYAAPDALLRDSCPTDVAQAPTQPAAAPISGRAARPQSRASSRCPRGRRCGSPSRLRSSRPAPCSPACPSCR